MMLTSLFIDDIIYFMKTFLFISYNNTSHSDVLLD